jgi:hypothetical protein
VISARGNLRRAALSQILQRRTAVYFSIGLCLGWLAPVSACAETLALAKTFVEQVKNRATMTVEMKVDVHPKSPHRIKDDGDDGDIHMAGRADAIGLPLVAEILNAKQEVDAMKLLNATPKHGTLSMTGAWRVWFEHLGDKPQVQFAKVAIPKSSNPAHLFELHPITKFGPLDLRDSLQPIPGYEPYGAEKAFAYYESISATIQASKTAILLASGKAKFNYAEFYFETVGPVAETGDGCILLAQIYADENAENFLTEQPRRLVFIEGDLAGQARHLGEGERLHVMAVPRVNLLEVQAIAAANKKSSPVKVHLPYELIIVAVYP